MNKNKALVIAIITCGSLAQTINSAVHAVPQEEAEASIYGRDITIKNNSPYELTVSVKNDKNMPTEIVIPGNKSKSILVHAGKKVTMHANVDGKIMKNNFKRKHNTENTWEIKIRKGFTGGIEIAKRSSDIR